MSESSEYGTKVTTTKKIINIVIPARNEEKHIKKTLLSLVGQTYPINKVVIVDDGSTDKTVHIVRTFSQKKFKMILVERKNRIGGISLVGRPEIATTFNIGFKEACRDYYDFIMVLGADTQLEKDYIKKLTQKFLTNGRLAIASGFNPKAPINSDHANGSGRMIDRRFWKWYGEKYPLIYGWESHCLIECLRLGLEVRSYPDIRYTVSRKGQVTMDFFHWGRGMKALGYHPLVVLLRGVRFVVCQKYGLTSAIRLMAGYLSETAFTNLTEEYQETRKFLYRYNLASLPRKLERMIHNILK